MNLAAIWNLPVLFVCENNRYAESTPFEYAVAGQSVANRAAGYGMPGVTVDGQNVIEVYEVAGEAVERARKGEGPTLIEAMTYRYHGHFGADNPMGYRTPEEQKYYENKDCIIAMEQFLVANGTATKEQLEAIDNDAKARVEKATQFAIDSDYPDPSELLRDVYIKYPQFINKLEIKTW